jgi:hypothetical protein
MLTRSVGNTSSMKAGIQDILTEKMKYVPSHCKQNARVKGYQLWPAGQLYAHDEIQSGL